MGPQIIEIANEKNRLIIINHAPYTLSLIGIENLRDAFSELFNSIELKFEAEIILSEFSIFPIVCAEIMVLLYDRHASFCHSMQSYDITTVTVESIKECLCAIKYVEINPDAFVVNNSTDEDDDAKEDDDQKAEIKPLPTNFKIEDLFREINEDRKKDRPE